MRPVLLQLSSKTIGHLVEKGMYTSLNVSDWLATSPFPSLPLHPTPPHPCVGAVDEQFVLRSTVFEQGDTSCCHGNQVRPRQRNMPRIACHT